MDPTRRDLLVGLTAAGLTTACGKSGEQSDTADSGSPPAALPAPDREAEPAPWAAPGSHDPPAFAHGVTAGGATAEGVLIHVRTDEVGCELVVVAQDGTDWTEVARVPGLDPTGNAVRHELTGLDADTAHAYALYASDGTRRSQVGRFRTAPAADATPRKLVLAATSCWGSINPDLPSLAPAAEPRADAILLLGDTVYADGAVSEEDYRRKWGRVLERPNAQTFLASASVIATWDDHEVDNNWVLGETVTADQLATATAAFREAIPQREGSAGNGMWRVMSLGPVAEIFVMDSRGERGPGRIASDEQIETMTAAIRASTATFKIVMCSVHLTDHTAIMGSVEAEDRWQGYEAQREALVRACEETPGAFVVTGDMHFSAVQLVGRTGEPGEQIVEIAAGPAGSRVVPMQEIVNLAVEPTDQYVWLGEVHTTSILTLDPGTGEVVAEFLDDSGAVVNTHTWTP